MKFSLILIDTYSNLFMLFTYVDIHNRILKMLQQEGLLRNLRKFYDICTWPSYSSIVNYVSIQWHWGTLSEGISRMENIHFDTSSRKFVLVSLDAYSSSECQFTINENIYIRQTILRGYGDRAANGRSSIREIVVKMHTDMPIVLCCEEDGWNKEIRQVWGVLVQPEWLQKA